jgi:hypothetical protein
MRAVSIYFQFKSCIITIIADSTLSGSRRLHARGISRQDLDYRLKATVKIKSNCRCSEGRCFFLIHPIENRFTSNEIEVIVFANVCIDNIGISPLSKLIYFTAHCIKRIYFTWICGKCVCYSICDFYLCNKIQVFKKSVSKHFYFNGQSIRLPRSRQNDQLSQSRHPTLPLF